MTLTTINDLAEMDDREILEYINELEEENAALVNGVTDAANRIKILVSHCLDLVMLSRYYLKGLKALSENDIEMFKNCMELIEVLADRINNNTPSDLLVYYAVAKDDNNIVDGNDTKH